MLSGWTVKPVEIMTKWSDKISPDSVWTSYPRPKLQRLEWLNLNGLWKCAITSQECDRTDVVYDMDILVPFAIESSLSGVQKSLLPSDRLWYKREFTVPGAWLGKDIILHFGAVDYECSIWVNDKYVGSHRGGSNPFSFNITEYLDMTEIQTLEVVVRDPTDTEAIARGKQKLGYGRIMYTPVSGIWKTVWLEPVASTHFTEIMPYTDISSGSVELVLDVSGAKGGEYVSVELEDGTTSCGAQIYDSVENVRLVVQNPILWTPDTPKLYGVRVKLFRDGELLDEVKSYFALRKISVGKDTCGYNRIMLNDKEIFSYGTLDQGWWPDGLLTPPSEEAMLWDLQQIKSMGFNSVRKHVKVEPELFYYYADSLGLMVWQDMVSGFETEKRAEQCLGPNSQTDWDAPQEYREQWEKELFDMLGTLRFYPSIIAWVVFNEGWGQYDTHKIVSSVADYDSTRIVNGVSGWKDRGVGNVYDVHNYPYTCMILPENNGDRISVLGEFGGLGYPVNGHLWRPGENNWGYKNLEGVSGLLADYVKLAYDLEGLIAQGLGAAIYTQTTDVEGEINGFITYDRKIIKLPVKLLHVINSRLYDVEPVSADILVQDTQGGSPSMKMVCIDGKDILMTMPVHIADGSLVSISNFNIDREYQHLSIWLNMTADVEVYINDFIVFKKNLKEFRQFTHFNISDYANLLHKGENELKIVADIKGRTSFDYGLRAY